VSPRTDQLRALARICRAFGGQLAIVSQSAYDAIFLDESDHIFGGNKLHDAPFTSAHGLHWGKKIIYAVRGREEVGGIIHEMGHVFASCHHPEHSCAECHEWDWFGWEIALARQIDATRTWSRNNVNYSTKSKYGIQLWGKLTPHKRRYIVDNRLALARERGILDENDHPRSVR
jgi:hypothetical protein